MPLFDALASASLAKITEFLSMELSNTAWAWADIGVCHGPLLAAISSRLIAMSAECDMQALSNTVWACATLLYHDAPLREAIACQALVRRDLGAQNVTTLLWSFWRLTWSPDAWPIVDRSVGLGVHLDAMGFSYGIMLAEWAKEEDRGDTLFGLMEQSPCLRLPVQLFALVSRWRGSPISGPASLSQPSHAYNKIAMLLDFVEVQAEPGDPASFLRAIEHFGAGLGQWLKVAGDTKAELLEASMQRRPARRSEVCAELGTFVGYTAIRLARWVRGPGPAPGRSVSLEVDAIHVLLTRHHLGLARLAHAADVWVGQALDLIPRLAEDFGGRGLGLAFMDHRGTKFHSDLHRIQRVAAAAPGCAHVCDNVLKPGAPACLWAVRAGQRVPGQGSAENWSMNEFAHWNSEDWMLVNML
mmetsp:Transcript_66421/g.174133  ORF Transcript_66421/g.174133 Transcript_66421/m.174133 type:complete len:414 (+) Transcript_66421:1880-3121(+)